MLIALASPRVASTVEECLTCIRDAIAEAAAQGGEIVCFPEAYLPGLRGLDFEVPSFDMAQQAKAIQVVAEWSRSCQIATILGMEWLAEAGRQIAAVIIDSSGTVMGCQTKNQLDPSEEPFYIPGQTRQMFEMNGLKFGVAICHEGFRYPETVRWAAVRGAKVVFHPHCTGSDKTGPSLSTWGSTEGPYYEKAMMCRAMENTIYLAGVNYGFRYQESATCVIAPTGECIAQQPYGQPGVLVHNVDLEAASGLLASRYAPQRYQESVGE